MTPSTLPGLLRAKPVRWATTALVGLTAAAATTGCGAQSKNADAVLANGKVDLHKVTLSVGDQKGGSRSVLRAAGQLDNVPYKIQWHTFTSGPPLLEALKDRKSVV